MGVLNPDDADAIKISLFRPERTLAQAHAELKAMGLAPLTPPLYYKSGTGNRIRTQKPTAADRANLRLAIYPRDDYTCQICFTRFEAPVNYDGLDGIPGLTLGHIVDYRLGGPYEIPNLRAECLGCNARKAFMSPRGSEPRAEGVGDGAYGESQVSK